MSGEANASRNTHRANARIELPASGTRVKVTGTVEQNGFVCTINVTALEIAAE